MSFKSLFINHLCVFIIVFVLAPPMVIKAQSLPDTLPLYEKTAVSLQTDWLLDSEGAVARLYRDEDGHLVFSNGLVARTFTVVPDGACISFENLVNDEELLRSVRPEATVTIDSHAIDVGGLYGQPVHNYLLPEWLEHMTPQMGNFHLKDFKVNPIRERFAWKKRLEWMPRELPWPPPGKELIFSYMLTDDDIEAIFKRTISDDMRPVLYDDYFTVLSKDWKIKTSKAHERTSFINEGKAGEIMAMANTYAFADISVPENARVFMVTVDPGTDNSKIFGPGIALLFHDKTIKLNLRPGDKRFGFYDGKKTTFKGGMQPGKAVTLRIEMTDSTLTASRTYDGKSWEKIAEIPWKKDERPLTLRVGKTDWVGGASDHPEQGGLIRCRVEEVKILGAVPGDKRAAGLDALAYLRDVVVKVHYELYDNIPLFCKWITVENNSGKTISVDKFKSEILAVTDAESNVGGKSQWKMPKIHIETDYSFGGGMSSSAGLGKSYHWNTDPLYLTQVNYLRQSPYLLECYPQYGPAQDIRPGESFSSFRTWELPQKSYDRERQGLEVRKMYRTIAPWVTENPILMHVRKADNESVKIAIDQCADVGFEMVIMTFGSGFNLENQNEENLNRMKELADYAHARGVALGGYSLLASRRIDAENDVMMPGGMRPTFGNSPCLESKWGHEYFMKLYNFYETTGQDILEHDGSYPGDPCASTKHPGHKGLADSQWNQWRRITDFYKWCRATGIYLNVPDWYFLNGSTKVAMGYRETNWSLPRKQQEIIERQNVYDGTWAKTPSMGWMFVPLVQYHGGGEAATIEPLKDHLRHYEQRLANLFGNGVQACYRGPRLYDAPETRTIVKKWVDFYKKHRAILDSDVIHVRRPDGRDYDGLLHVNPQLEEKGMLMLYNPLEEPVKRTITINLYYTGLRDKALISKNDGNAEKYTIDCDHNVKLDIDIPARGWTWYVVR